MPDDPLSFAASVGVAPLSADGPPVLPADPQVAASMAKWLGVATNPSSADTRLFAKLIAERDVRGELALSGLQQHEWNALLSRHFAHASAFQLRAAAHSRAGAEAGLSANADTETSTGFVPGSAKSANSATSNVTPAESADFVRTLHTLLLTHTSAAVDADDARDLATIIAHACLRPDHLWRDLGLAGRDEVTWMLTRYFPTLVALNVANLRWKKFFAAERALSVGLPPGPAPGCPGCEDYGYCFASPC